MAEIRSLAMKDLEKVMGGTGDNGDVGFNCARCGTFISITPMQLINSNVIECPVCHEKYSIDSTGSAKAEEAIRKIQEAQENLGK